MMLDKSSRWARTSDGWVASVGQDHVEKKSNLVPIGTFLMTPGASSETLAMFCGRVDSDGAGGIYVIEHGGKRPRKVADVAAFDDRLSWSPDGTRIAYADGDAVEADIFAVDVADGRVQPVVTGEGNDLSPSWSPSGGEIVFSSTRTGQAEVWAVDVATAQLNQITTDGGNSYPSVSPSGDKIAWIKRDRGVMVYDGSTGEVTALLAPRLVVFAPAWSPDERYLAVTASDWGSADVYLMKTDGSNALLLTKKWKSAGMPSWSPDGERIAVASQSDEGKFSVWVLEGLRPYLQRLETRMAPQVFIPPPAQ